MNLIDAVKSGRPFKRPCMASFLEKWDGCYSEVLRFAEALATFTVNDILADDWEIQEPAARITRGQFWEAVEAIKKLYPEPKYGSVCQATASQIARQLGLE